MEPSEVRHGPDPNPDPPQQPSSLPKIISVEDYLNTTYRPDVDYVDGEIEERNLGEFDHGDLQLAIGRSTAHLSKGLGHPRRR